MLREPSTLFSAADIEFVVAEIAFAKEKTYTGVKTSALHPYIRGLQCKLFPGPDEGNKLAIGSTSYVIVPPRCH